MPLLTVLCGLCVVIALAHTASVLVTAGRRGRVSGAAVGVSYVESRLFPPAEAGLATAAFAAGLTGAGLISGRLSEVDILTVLPIAVVTVLAGAALTARFAGRAVVPGGAVALVLLPAVVGSLLGSLGRV